MILKCIVLSGRSQTQKATYRILAFRFRHPGKGKTVGSKKDLWLLGVKGRRGVDFKDVA